jgi:Protein of unknown function (DUF3592)
MLLFIICYVPVALIFLVTGILHLQRARAETQLATELATTGHPIRGEITSHMMHARGRRNFWTVGYQYRKDDRTYEGEQEVSRDHYQLLRDGDEVALHYLQNDPYVAVLAGEDRDDARMRRHRNSALALLGLSLVCVLLLIFSLCLIHR